MKLLFLKAGRVAHREAEQWTTTYTKRLAKAHEVELRIAKEGSLLKTLTDLKKNRDLKIWMLDERGKAFDTKSLAAAISDSRSEGQVKQLVFVVGGSYGLSDDERKQADRLWSLSPLTLAGDVAWVVLIEQIYRAFTVLEGHPYHHE